MEQLSRISRGLSQHSSGASQAQSKYAVGDLVAGGEHFQVTIFVTLFRDTYRIQQLKIDMVR